MKTTEALATFATAFALALGLVRPCRAAATAGERPAVQEGDVRVAPADAGRARAFVKAPDAAPDPVLLSAPSAVQRDAPAPQEKAGESSAADGQPSPAVPEPESGASQVQGGTGHAAARLDGRQVLSGPAASELRRLAGLERALPPEGSAALGSEPALQSPVAAPAGPQRLLPRLAWAALVSAGLTASSSHHWARVKDGLWSAYQRSDAARPFRIFVDGGSMASGKTTFAFDMRNLLRDRLEREGKNVYLGDEDENWFITSSGDLRTKFVPPQTSHAVEIYVASGRRTGNIPPGPINARVYVKAGIPTRVWNLTKRAVTTAKPWLKPLAATTAVFALLFMPLLVFLDTLELFGLLVRGYEDGGRLNFVVLNRLWTRWRGRENRSNAYETEVLAAEDGIPAAARPEAGAGIPRTLSADAVIAAYQAGRLAETGLSADVAARLGIAADQAARRWLASAKLKTETSYGLQPTMIYSVEGHPGLIVKTYSRRLGDAWSSRGRAWNGYRLAKERLGDIFAPTTIVEDASMMVDGKPKRVAWALVQTRMEFAKAGAADWDALDEELERRGIRDADDSRSGYGSFNYFPQNISLAGPRFRVMAAEHVGRLQDGRAVFFDADRFRATDAGDGLRRLSDPEPLAAEIVKEQRDCLASLGLR